MRLVMMGTGAFAVPTFQSLLDSDHAVAALVTQPPREIRGRRNRRAAARPMRELAEAHGLPILAPQNINTVDARAALEAMTPDLLVVCDFGQILSPEMLAVPRWGGVNLHGSLLPRYRGAAPVNWAIYDGAAETGVTVIHMTPDLDAGPCLVQRSTPIGPEETAVELETRLAKLGPPAVLEAVDLLAAAGDKRVGRRQDAALASKAPRLKKTDGRVDWTRTAEQIKNQIRAMKPWPGTYTHWQRPDREPLRLILDRVTIASDEVPKGGSGTVVAAGGKRLAVAAGSGALVLEAVQPAGKRVMPIDQFLRGYPIRLGDRLG